MEFDALHKELAELTAVDAPVGFEEPMLRLVRDRLAPLVDSVEVDVRGNVYGIKESNAPAAPRVLVLAHVDEIGFLVTGITPQGFLRFTKLGGPTDHVLPGQPVRVLAAGTKRDGTIGARPAHVLSGEEARRVPPPDRLYIDVGATSADEVAHWGIEPGTPVVYRGPLTATANPRRVFGKAMDNRAGVLAMLKAAERLRGESIAPTVIWCAPVEEEVGLRGAAVAAAKVQPDVVLAVDTVPAGGTPDLSGDELPWQIGKGPLLKVREVKGLSTHRPLRELVRRFADRHGLPYQWIVDTAGVTDATAAQQAGAGIAAMVLGLGRRYSHSAVEMLDLADVQAMIDLLVVTLPELDDLSKLLRI
ncbi:MAG: M42 family metallopeptidase [Pirellulales bacterium]